MALWRMQTLLGDIHGTEEKQAILLAQLQAEGLPEKKKGNAKHYSNHYQGRKKALSADENCKAAAQVRQPAILKQGKKVNALS